MDLFPVVAVLGARQCWKSTLFKQLFPDWKYYDLECPDDYELISSDPLGFFSRHKNRVVIDEAQQFPQLFSILRSVIDEDRTIVGRFILTGSSSPDIVKGLSESLAGRIATVELSPFKTAELHNFDLPKTYDLLANLDTTIHDFNTLESTVSQSQIYAQWMYGGYPKPRIKSQDHPDFYQLWMDGYFTDFIHRDIQRLFPRINTHRLFKGTGLSFGCSHT